MKLIKSGLVTFMPYHPGTKPIGPASDARGKVREAQEGVHHVFCPFPSPMFRHDDPNLPNILLCPLLYNIGASMIILLHIYLL